MQKALYPWLVILLGGYVNPPSCTAAPPSNADREFAHISEDYLNGYLAWRPQTGTALGFHQYDGQLTDYSRPSLDRELARLKAFQRQLADLAPNTLSSQSAHDYQLLKNSINREIFTFDQLQAYKKNPMTYAGVLDVNIYIKRNFAPLEDRVRSIISILNQAPAVVSAAQVNLEESLPKPLVEMAVEQANGTVDFLGKDLVAALQEVRNQPLMSQFHAANQRAMEQLRNYATFLQERKLPKANEHYALGPDKYRTLLQDGEMITVPPERLLEIGLEELRKKQESFAADARQIDPTKPPLEVFLAIQKDHPPADQLIPDTAKDLEMIRSYVITHKIVTLPSPVRAAVAETPQFMRATSFASMDTPGPFETKATEAYYYVTPVEANWTAQQKDEWLSAFNYYTTDIVSIHEAYPGHYVQFLCLNASRANKLEKIFTSYAFVEGWAHYAEQMMVDEGFGAEGLPAPSAAQQIKAAKYRLAQTDEALLRLCRFCVSIKMHCQGMTVEEATRFFQDNCYYQPKPARQEAIRGTFDPEYLYYTLGKLEFLKLREDYRKQQGSAFNLQQFHDEVLRHGAPPIRLLRQIMLKSPTAWAEVL